MESLASIAPGYAGFLIWVAWILIGLFEGLTAARMFGRKRIVFMDCVVGMVAAAIGGILSTNFIGDTPIQLFLVSILGAIFFSAAALWIVGVIFYKNEENQENL